MDKNQIDAIRERVERDRDIAPWEMKVHEVAQVKDDRKRLLAEVEKLKIKYEKNEKEWRTQNNADDEGKANDV